MVCWIICLVRLRAARWSRVHEHLIVWLFASLLWSCITLNLKVLLMGCLQPGHTSSGCGSCKLTAFFRLVGLSSSALLSSFMWWPLVVGSSLQNVSVGLIELECQGHRLQPRLMVQCSKSTCGIAYGKTFWGCLICAFGLMMCRPRRQRILCSLLGSIVC